MLYDLNLAWTPSASAQDLSRLIQFSAALGYGVVALNHLIHAPLPAKPSNPLPPPSELFPPAPASTQTFAAATAPAIVVLRRATIVLADPTLNFRLPTLTPLYDILAVRPTTPAALQAACLTLADVAIVSLDLAAPAHAALPLRSRPIQAAIARGVRFELSYGQLLAAPDARCRAAWLAGATSLLRATRGRGVLISSGAAAPHHLRAPADVVNLLAVWGLPTDRGRDALGPIPRSVVVNERIRRTGYRGVVDIVQRPDAPALPVVPVRESSAKALAGPQTTAADPDDGQKTSAPAEKQSHKRKTASENTINQPTLNQMPSTQHLSKRSTKRQKRPQQAPPNASK